MGNPPTEGHDSFDVASFVERWREAEPVLRRRASRFKIEEGQIDDLLSEVATRMFARQLSPGASDFVAVADHMAYRLVLGWNRTQRRRRRLDEMRFTHDDPLDRDADDERERLELRLSVEQAMQSEPFASLSVSQRRAVRLLLRGGPFTGPERRAIHDAKGDPRWLRLFEELLGIAAPVWVRARTRALEPGLAAPALFAAAVVALGGFAGVLEPGEAGARPVQGQGLRGESTAAADAAAGTSPAAPPAGTGSRLTASGAPGPPPTTTRPGLIGTSVTTRLPGATGDGAVEVVVLRGDPLPAGTDLAVPVYCDSALRRAVCDAVSAGRPAGRPMGS